MELVALENGVSGITKLRLLMINAVSAMMMAPDSSLLVMFKFSSLGMCSRSKNQ